MGIGHVQMAKRPCSFGHFPSSRRTRKRYTDQFRQDWRFAFFMPGNLNRHRPGHEQRLFTGSIASRQAGSATSASSVHLAAFTSAGCDRSMSFTITDCWSRGFLMREERDRFEKPASRRAVVNSLGAGPAT